MSELERLQERLTEVVDPELHDPELESLRAFVRRDPSAAALVREQRALESLLEEALSIPEHEVQRPLPPRRVVRRPAPWMRWAAAAALLVATGTFWMATDTMLSRSTTRAPDASELAEARRATGDRLVALTAGWDVVAMRRPAEGR